MPRRDVVLTGLISFGAGVAVGANWPKIRKKIGPLLETLGLQMADLGDFLSATGHEDFAEEIRRATSPKAKAKASTKAKNKTSSAKKKAAFSVVKPTKKAARSAVVTEDFVKADGTFGA